MKMKSCFTLFVATVFAVAGSSLMAAEGEPGFVSLFDGKTFNGWKKAEEHPDTWKIENGALIAHGDPDQKALVAQSRNMSSHTLMAERDSSAPPAACARVRRATGCASPGRSP